MSLWIYIVYLYMYSSVTMEEAAIAGSCKSCNSSLLLSAPGNLFGDTVHFSNFFKFLQAADFNLASSRWHVLKPIHVAVC